MCNIIDINASYDFNIIFDSTALFSLFINLQNSIKSLFEITKKFPEVDQVKSVIGLLAIVPNFLKEIVLFSSSI
jgi:hypothetical protein